MEKKLISVIILAALFVGLLANRAAFAPEKQAERYFEYAAANAGNVLLYDLDTETVLYAKKTQEHISVGSINKLLTASIALEYLSPDDVFTVGEEVDYYLTADASRAMIRNGQRITFRQLLIAMLLPSGCDATHTVVVNVVRKIKNDPGVDIREAIDYFCGMMNSRARALGCTDSHFVNPDGQDDERQYTCVNDVFLFLRRFLENDLVREIVAMPHAEVTLVSGEKYSWDNTNKMLQEDSPYYYPYMKGVKTGFTLGAGYAMTAYAEKNGRRLLSIVCRCNQESYRYTVSANLIRLGYISIGEN